MSLTMDPEIGEALAAFLAKVGRAAPPPAGDWQTRRAAADTVFPMLLGTGLGNDDVRPTVVADDRTIPLADGGQLAARWYRLDGAAAAPGPAVVYLHGGGMIFGSVGLYERAVAEYVRSSGVPFLSVDYRLAPENPAPGPVEDCYAALSWFAGSAGDVGVDPARIAIMGDSAGGGLAAGVALLAAERGGPALARQILIYPMLDDRTTVPDPRLTDLVTWTYDDNLTGWRALLGDAAGGPDVPAASAPARATDLSGLPPAYLDVGDLDIFCVEDLAYAAALTEAGVPVEMHLHPGGPHGFEVYAPDSALAKRALADRLRVIGSL